MSKLRPAGNRDVILVSNGIVALKDALDCFTEANCPKTAERVRLALSSAKGAQRHVERRARSTR